MAWRIRLRGAEGCEEQPFLSPDLVVVATETGARLDFARAEADEVRNTGGLRSKEGLHTAILIQLFSDARAAEQDVLPDDLDPNRRGWWGDSVAPAEEQSGHVLGSRLWTLSRATLDDNTAVLANDIVRTALQPIVDQGAVARFDVETSSNYQSPAGNGTGILAIGIRGYGRDGALSYDQRFEVLWEQIKNMRR